MIFLSRFLLMSLDQQTVRSIAALARVKLAEDEVEHLVGELNNILGWVEQLAEVDTQDTPPMASVVGTALSCREDEITDGGCAQDILANAPEHIQGFFVVPKVIE